MKNRTNDWIEKALEEQQTQHAEPLNEQDKKLYTFLVKSLQEEADRQSVVDSVMARVWVLEERKEAKKNGKVVALSMAVAVITIMVVYYFYLPMGFQQIVLFIKHHALTILFVLSMIGLIQYADRKLVREKLMDINSK